MGELVGPVTWVRRSACLATLTVAFASVLIMAANALGAQRVITSPGPLTDIYLNDNLGCQVEHTGDTNPEFFGGTNPGSCGTFLHTSGTLYGPFLGTAYSLVSQSGITGSGTSASPYRVVTVVDAGSPALRITQTDSYVTGDEFYRTDIEVSNSTGAAIPAALYHAADCYLQDSDSGYGFYDSEGGGIYCSANANNSPAARILGFVPLSGGSNYIEDFYSTVYGEIDGTQFPNTCDCAILQDNGAGLSWSLSVPAGGSVTRSLFSAFSPTGDTPTDDPPTYGDDADIEPVGGTVRYRVPGSDDFLTLTGDAQIPVGTIIDTREGRVRLTSAARPGSNQTQTADFFSGLFQLLQPDEDPPVTELNLLGFKQSDCTGASDEVSILRRRRGLWGSGRGRFRVRGRHGSASVRGTRWFTWNRCDGTYFEVAEGSITVRDFTRDRAVIVRAGETYLAPSVVTIDAGDDFNCGLQLTQKVICWGDNTFGQATPPGGDFTAVSAGDAHACGVRPAGKLVCWGNDGRGQASPPGGSFDAVSAGGSHTCGLRTNGALACWGRNGGGQATPPGGTFDAVSAGAFHTCAIRTGGTLDCWGNDAFGQATPPPGSFDAVSAGAFHTCGLRANDTLACWGRNAAGRATPPPGSFDAVSAGGAHSCGIRTNGDPVCWGRNGSGQATPPEATFTALSAGRSHTCGVKSNGAATCWGSDSGG